MDKSVLDGIPSEERRRQEVMHNCHRFGQFLTDSFQAIFELIATESTYVRDLQLIVGVSMFLETSHGD
jgi:hypothetical protein